MDELLWSKDLNEIIAQYPTLLAEAMENWNWSAIVGGLTLVLLLCLSLRGMNHKDPLTGLLYTLFIQFSAVGLILAAPRLATDHSDTGLHIALCTFAGLIAGYRWLRNFEYRWSPQKEIEELDTVAPKVEEK